MSNNLYILLIPVILFSLLFLYSIVKKLYLYSFLIGLYAGTFICSLILDLFYEKSNYDLTAVLFLCFVIYVMILPAKRFKITKLRISNNELLLLKKVTIVLGVLSFISIIFYLPYVSEGLSGNISNNRLDANYSRKIVSNVFSLVFSIVANIFYLNVVLFFISLIYRWPRRYVYISLISSLTVIFNVLANVGRDGFVLWTFSFIITFLLFRSFLSKSNIIFLKRTFLFFTVIFLPIILAISISRFSVLPQFHYNVLYSLLDYQGQQLRNFCATFQELDLINKDFYLTPNLKYQLYKLFGEHYSVVKQLSIMEDDFQSAGQNFYVFGTFVKDLLLNFGYFGTILFSLIFNVILRFVIRSNSQSISISRILIGVVFIQIPLFGVYYYRQWISSYDYTYILLGLLILGLQLKKKKILVPKFSFRRTVDIIN